MMSPRKNDVEQVPGEVLQLPVEERPWTGFTQPARYLPPRLVAAPMWLEDAEADVVLSTTWDGFIQVLRREGYQAMRALCERLDEHHRRHEEEVRHFTRVLEDLASSLDIVRRASEEFGAEAKVEEADGHAGWEQRGARLWPPDTDDSDQARLSVPMGTTWQDEIDAMVFRITEARQRRTLAGNASALLAFRAEMGAEVLRHFEMYGVLWSWAEPSDMTGALADPMLDTSKRGRFVPYYEWIVAQYHELRPNARSAKQARESTIQAFHDAYDEEFRNRYGVYPDGPSDSLLRTILGER